MSILQESEDRMRQKGFSSKLWKGSEFYCCLGGEVEEGQTSEQESENSEQGQCDTQNGHTQTHTHTHTS